MGPVLQGEGGAFVPSVSVQKQLEQEDSIWFGTQKQEVIVSVDPAVASYFQARALLPHQQIIRTLTDGSLLVSCQMVDSLQVLPLVRFWLPHLRIISPDSLREELMAGLKAKPRPVQGRCAACAQRDICGGNTRVRAQQITGNPWAEDPGCYLDDAEIGVETRGERIAVTPFAAVGR